MLKLMLIAGCGGFVGSCGRFLVCRYATTLCRYGFPVGTFAVNLIGCLLIGIFLGLAAKEHSLGQAGSALLITGFCGGFTTFSSFAADTWLLAQKGDWVTMAAYILLSVALGLLLVVGGKALVR